MNENEQKISFLIVNEGYKQFSFAIHEWWVMRFFKKISLLKYLYLAVSMFPACPIYQSLDILGYSRTRPSFQ
jgi:hypothetical protein